MVVDGRGRIISLHHVVRVPVTVAIGAVHVAPARDMGVHTEPGVVAPATAGIVAGIGGAIVHRREVAGGSAAVIVLLLGGRGVCRGNQFSATSSPVVQGVRVFLVEFLHTRRGGIDHLARAHQSALAVPGDAQYAVEHFDAGLVDIEAIQTVLGDKYSRILNGQ